MSMRKNVALSVGALSALVLSLSASSPASAQIIYEPVQSEHRTEHGKYYYGGSDPQAHEWAYRRLECLRGYTGVHEGRYGYGYIHGKLIGRPPEYVVSDCAPYLNAAAYGMSSTDARHEAYGHSAGYFRKSDVLKEAVPAADGKGMVVPANAGISRIDIRPYRRMMGPTTRPTTRPAAEETTAAPDEKSRTEPKPVLIIPKDQLKLKVTPNKSVVVAQ
jgi:hypothetical protein